MTTSDAGQARRNAVLERLLAQAGWTPENLGDRLNELATALNLRMRVHRRTLCAGGSTPRRNGRYRAYRVIRGRRWCVMYCMNETPNIVIWSAPHWPEQAPDRRTRSDRQPTARACPQ